MAIYRGLSFPFRIEGSDFPAATSDAELLRESVIQILSTNRGERLMRPTFGVNALTALFESSTDLLVAQLKAQVLDSLARYEPRIIVENISVQRQDNMVIVAVTYIIRATRQRDTATVGASDPNA